MWGISRLGGRYHFYLLEEHFWRKKFAVNNNFLLIVPMGDKCDISWYGSVVTALFYAIINPISHREKIITARKRSLRRLCFYTCLSVHRRGSTWAGTHTPGPGAPPGTRYPPIPGTPPRPGTPLGRYTPWAGTPPGTGTPPQSSACWEIRATTSGRYASYWNAFLFCRISQIYSRPTQ